MHARSTTFHGRPETIDAGIARVRDDVLPAVRQLEGCVGLSLLVDRGTGRCIVATSWTDVDAMHRNAGTVDRIQAAAVDGATDATDEWEVGVLHRVLGTPEDATCRVIYARGPLDSADRVIDGFRTNVVPRIDDLAGFCSVSLFVDRATGRCAITSVYEDRQTMNRAKGQAQALREEFTLRMGLRITEVAEYEVALAHLRVPETV